MAGDRYEQIVGTTDRVVQDSQDGSLSPLINYAGRLLSADANGQIPAPLFPAVGAPLSITTAEALAAGDWVNIFYSGANWRVQKATSLIWTGAAAQYKVANGFVLTGVGAGLTAQVYTSGINSAATLDGGAFATTNVGKPVFLAYTTSGKALLVPPASHTDGASHRAIYMIQPLGIIHDVAAPLAKIQFYPVRPIEKHSVYNSAAQTNAGANPPVYTSLTIDVVETGEYMVHGYFVAYQSSGTIGNVVFHLYEGITSVVSTVMEGVNTSYSAYTLIARRLLTAGSSYTFALQVVNGSNRNFSIDEGRIWVQKV